MKKLILTVVALMSMTMTFAENENAANTNTVEAYNMNVNMNKLSQALGLSDDQIEAVYEIHSMAKRSVARRQIQPSTVTCLT